MTQLTDWIPIDEVAALLETTRLHVLLHIKQGLLKGEDLPGGWCVTRGSLDQFLSTTGEDRPRVFCRSDCSKAAGCAGCQ
jgi:hypothetical protein